MVTHAKAFNREACTSRGNESNQAREFVERRGMAFFGRQMAVNRLVTEGSYFGKLLETPMVAIGFRQKSEWDKTNGRGLGKTRATGSCVRPGATGVRHTQRGWQGPHEIRSARTLAADQGIRGHHRVCR